MIGEGRAASGFAAISALAALAPACAHSEPARATSAETPVTAEPAPPPSAAPRPTAPSPSASPSPSPSPSARTSATWVPPDCGRTNSYYMVDCKPETDPSCPAAERMKPVRCPPR